MGSSSFSTCSRNVSSSSSSWHVCTGCMGEEVPLVAVMICLRQNHNELTMWVQLYISADKEGFMTKSHSLIVIIIMILPLIGVSASTPGPAPCCWASPAEAKSECAPHCSCLLTMAVQMTRYLWPRPNNMRYICNSQHTWSSPLLLGQSFWGEKRMRAPLQPPA
jgi:hypothetical protein